MACGYLRIIADYPEVGPHLMARVLAWAGADAQLIDTSTSGRNISVVISERTMAGKGPLLLIDEGPDLLTTCFVSGRTKVTSVGPGEVTKPSMPGGPSIFGLETTHLNATLKFAADHFSDVYWGDGPVTTNLHPGRITTLHRYVHIDIAFVLKIVDRTTKLSAEAIVVPVAECS
jgi:hypothetical protein